MSTTKKTFYNTKRLFGPGVLSYQVKKNLNNNELWKYELKGIKNKHNGRDRSLVNQNGKLNEYQRVQAIHLQKAYNKGFNGIIKRKKQTASIFKLPNNILDKLKLIPRKVHMNKMLKKISNIKNINKINKTHLRFLKSLLARRGNGKFSFKSIVIPNTSRKSHLFAWFHYAWDKNIPLLSYQNNQYHLRYTSDMKHEYNWNVATFTKHRNLQRVLSKYWMFQNRNYHANNNVNHNYGDGYYINSNGNKVNMENEFQKGKSNKSTHDLFIDHTALKMISKDIISFADFIYHYFKSPVRKYNIIFLEYYKGESKQRLLDDINMMLKYA